MTTTSPAVCHKCGAEIRYKFMGGGYRFQCESEEFPGGHYSQSEACQISTLTVERDAAREKLAEIEETLAMKGGG